MRRRRKREPEQREPERVLAFACRICGRELRRHEAPEGVCDGCLRGNQSR